MKNANKRGRPSISMDAKRARRNAKDRAKRAQTRQSKNKPPITTTPFTRGFEMLRASSQEAGQASSSTTIAVTRFGAKHELSTEQLLYADKLISEMVERNITGLSENSRRTMHTDWQHWLAFCFEMERTVLPVKQSDLMDFMECLQEAGYRRSTMEHYLFTIKYMSKLHQSPDPTLDFVFQSFWKDLRRTKLTSRQFQAEGLTLQRLSEITADIDLDDPIACRDSAMVSLMYDALLRSSEVVSLMWSDLHQEPDGSGTLTIRRSKTDQDGFGHEIYISSQTMSYINRWQRHSNPQAEVIFHTIRKSKNGVPNDHKSLSVKSVKAAFKRLSLRKGIEDIEFSGHSGRVGGAQDMTEAGMGLPEIMQIGRWKSPQMPVHYAQRRNAVNAGKNRFSKLNVILSKQER